MTMGAEESGQARIGTSLKKQSQFAEWSI